MEILMNLVDAIVPVGICVVLPCMILWIIYRYKTNRVNKNADVVLKAIENNSDIDVNQLVEAMSSAQKTSKQLLITRLLRGCIFSLTGIAVGIFAYICQERDAKELAILISCLLIAIGIAYLIVYFVTRKTVDSEKQDVTE